MPCAVLRTQIHNAKNTDRGLVGGKPTVCASLPFPLQLTTSPTNGPLSNHIMICGLLLGEPAAGLGVALRELGLDIFLLHPWWEQAPPLLASASSNHNNTIKNSDIASTQRVTCHHRRKRVAPLWEHQCIGHRHRCTENVLCTVFSQDNTTQPLL